MSRCGSQREAGVERGFCAECALGREKGVGGRFMSVHMEFRVIFPEFFQFSGRFSKAFYMLVIETHKIQFTTVLHSKVLVSLEHVNVTDFSGTIFSKRVYPLEERSALGFICLGPAEGLLENLAVVWARGRWLVGPDVGSLTDFCHSHF